MDGRLAGGGEARWRARRVLAAIADPKLEAALIPELAVGGRWQPDTCASARELLELLRGRNGGWAAVLTHDDLPHLHAGALDDLVRRGLPVVLLARDPESARWSDLPATVLPLDATPGEIEQGLEEALGGARVGRRARTAVADPRDALDPARAGGHVARRASAGESGASQDADAPDEHRAATVYAVVSGAGAPGRTTVALALATALGAVAPTVLVDADLAGPSVAAHLDADPSKNLYMLAGAALRTVAEWDRALADELQPLGAESPGCMVLCGVPRGGRGGAVGPQFLGRAVAVLGRRYRHIVLDVGAGLAGGDAAAALGRAAAARADHVLLVGSGDIPGLRRQLDAFEYLLEGLRIERRRIGLVVNRHDRATDHPQAEIERAFGQPLAALVPADGRAAGRALAAQRSLVLERRSRAATALLELAARAHGADLTRAVAGASGRGGDARRGWRWWPSPWRRDSAAGDARRRDDRRAAGEGA